MDPRQVGGSDRVLTGDIRGLSFPLGPSWKIDAFREPPQKCQ